LIFSAGKTLEAIPVVEKWVAIDPLHPLAMLTMGLIKWMNGDLEKATRELEKWHLQEPNDPIYSFYLGHILAWTGKREQALQMAEEMFLKNPDEFMGQTLRFLTLSINDRVEEAKMTVSPTMSEMAWMDFHLPWLMTESYSVLGDMDEAIKWFERTVEKGFFNYPLFNHLDPFLVNIRSDPRFIKIMESIKQKWENFEV
jgi:predicted Zn-dependent protease